MKTCKSCGELKSLEMFGMSKKRWYRNICKQCDASVSRLYQSEHAEQVSDRKKIYRNENFEQIQQRRSQYRKDNRHKIILQNAKCRAKNRGIPFDLCLEDIIIPEFCPILGISLTFDAVDKNSSPSLDRMTPDLGYVKGNVWIVSAKANRMKTDATPQDLLDFAKWVLSEFGDKEQING